MSVTLQNLALPSLLEMLLRFLAKQIFEPSLNAHSSASTLVAIPIALAKPDTQTPFWSRMTPPAPTLPKLPKAEPSIFSLHQFKSPNIH